MTKDTQSAFWNSIPSSLRNAVEQAVPSDILQETLSLLKDPESLETRYTQLKHLLKETINQEYQTKQSSEHRRNPDQSTNNSQRPPALFPLAMLQTETKQYTAAEGTCRQILAANPPSRPDSAATSNLIDVLNLQHKYAEVQTMATQALPLLQNELGAESPQYPGCMRKMMESLVRQKKSGEARVMYIREVMYLVATISNGDVKKEEGDAMQEMGQED